MKFLKIFALLLFITSCAAEDDYVPVYIEPVYVDHPESSIKVDITYILPSDTSSKSIYNLNEKEFIDKLNGHFFNRYNIGLELGNSKTMVNPELYDLTDNRNEETTTFMRETENSYIKNRVNVYIIKRANTIAIAGIGNDNRALITDEFVYTTTAAHEIGHALGLFHTSEEGNLMSQINPHLRTFFSDIQVLKMKNRIEQLHKRE